MQTRRDFLKTTKQYLFKIGSFSLISPFFLLKANSFDQRGFHGVEDNTPKKTLKNKILSYQELFPDPLNDKLIVHAKDIHSMQNIVSINADYSMRAASILKLGVCLAFLHRAYSEKKFIFGRKSNERMKRAITQSDNKSTDWMIKQVGGPRRVQEILDNHYSHLFKNTKIVEFFNGGQTYQNRTSARDLTRLFETLNKKDNNPPHKEKLLEPMKRNYHKRFFTPEFIEEHRLKLFTKTGTTSIFYGGSSIVYPTKIETGELRPFTLTIGIQRFIPEDLSKKEINIYIRNKGFRDMYNSWTKKMRKVVQDISIDIFKYLTEKYNLA